MRSMASEGGGGKDVWNHPAQVLDEQYGLYGSLAQLVEQLTFNQLVAGSNPARPTIIQNTGL